jgi:predicted ATP-grasp superfamily ATP-dependent carboligase
MGTGIMVEALPLPEIEAPARALLNAVQFHGVSEIEFKQDERTGTLYLIEINARHWDQHRLGVVAGVNLSEAAYRDATGQPLRPMHQHSEQAMWIAEADLLRYTARALFGRDVLPDLRACWGVRRTFGVLDFRDMRPILAMLGLLRKPRASGPVSAAPARHKNPQRVAR